MHNEYEIVGDITYVYLPTRYRDRWPWEPQPVFQPSFRIAVIDTVDLPRIQEYPGLFRATERYVSENPVWVASFLTHWLFSPPKGMWIDHINHDPLDNRRSNVRFVSALENQNNRRTMQFPRHPVRLLRLQRGLTRQAVQDATGISVATLTNWENFIRTPRPEHMERLAQYFRVPLSDLDPATTTIEDPLVDRVRDRILIEHPPSDPHPQAVSR